MSAICGLYAKNGNIDEMQSQAMFAELGRHQFDKSSTHSAAALFMGAHLNFVTPESLTEQLPFHDVKNNLTITADAIIDNRSELFELLDISADHQSISDSALILAAYQKWGTACPEKLVGDFTFAIWDNNCKQLFLARDHVGKRTLYYYNSPAMFAFSTLISPLFKLSELKKEPNEEYIADFLSYPTIPASLDNSLTVFKQVIQLPPACTLLLKNDQITIHQYWNNHPTAPIRFKTDAEYTAAFISIFKEAIKCRLRSVKQVGIMLSGGLDSGSVAAIAATELNLQQKPLFSYTQIPLADYQNNLLPDQMADESPFVRELCEFYQNIIPSFVDSPQKSPLTEIDLLIDVLEQPYKNFKNMYWLNGILGQAQKDQIGILLDGQSGNGTVSWGYFNSYITDLLKKRKFALSLKEIRCFSSLQNRSYLRTLIGCIYYNLPAILKDKIYQLRGGTDFDQLLSLANPDFIATKKMLKDPRPLESNDSLTLRKHILSIDNFTHFGVFENKLSIEFGLIKRDPTRDKRVIEFCLNIPDDQWVRNGTERRLIREAMQNILPDKYRLNTTLKGKQAADWLLRIKPEWPTICKEIATIGDFELEKKYLDIVKIKKILAENQEIKSTNKENYGLWLLIRALIFSRFLRKNFS